MATAQNTPPFSRPPLARVLVWTAGIVFVVVGPLLVVDSVFSADKAAFPSAPKITPVHSRPTISAPAPVRTADEGYRLISTDDALVAAREFCALVSAGKSVTGASAALVVGYKLTAKQASELGAAALEEHCPENRT